MSQQPAISCLSIFLWRMTQSDSSEQTGAPAERRDVALIVHSHSSSDAMCDVRKLQAFRCALISAWIVFPVDTTRVEIMETDSDLPGSDYINANYIRVSLFRISHTHTGTHIRLCLWMITFHPKSKWEPSNAEYAWRGASHEWRQSLHRHPRVPSEYGHWLLEDGVSGEHSCDRYDHKGAGTWAGESSSQAMVQTLFLRGLSYKLNWMNKQGGQKQRSHPDCRLWHWLLFYILNWRTWQNQTPKIALLS